MSEPYEEQLARVRLMSISSIKHPTDTAALRAVLEVYDAMMRMLNRYRWRPVSEIHEDFGLCVLMRIDDPGYMEVGSNLDEDWNEAGWTHFAEVPKLSHAEAEELKAKRPAKGAE